MVDQAPATGGDDLAAAEAAANDFAHRLSGMKVPDKLTAVAALTLLQARMIAVDCLTDADAYNAALALSAVLPVQVARAREALAKGTLRKAAPDLWSACVPERDG